MFLVWKHVKLFWSFSFSEFLTNPLLQFLAGHLYSIGYSTEEYGSSRKLRTSPLHTRLEVAGAIFGETNAYETALWFVPNADGNPL